MNWNSTNTLICSCFKTSFWQTTNFFLANILFFPGKTICSSWQVLEHFLANVLYSWQVYKKILANTKKSSWQLYEGQMMYNLDFYLAIFLLHQTEIGTQYHFFYFWIWQKMIIFNCDVFHHTPAKMQLMKEIHKSIRKTSEVYLQPNFC